MEKSQKGEEWEKKEKNEETKKEEEEGKLRFRWVVMEAHHHPARSSGTPSSSREELSRADGKHKKGREREREISPLPGPPPSYLESVSLIRLELPGSDAQSLASQYHFHILSNRALLRLWPVQTTFSLCEVRAPCAPLWISVSRRRPVCVNEYFREQVGARVSSWRGK